MAEKYSVLDVVNSIKLEYPIFKDIEVSDKRNEGMSDNRQLEYYSKEDSPTGKERVEIFNPNLQGEELKNAIFGDMLHSAPSKSKEYADKKLQLINSRTPEQIEIDNKAYEIAIKQGEKRPFDKWYAVSRSDAFIRGYLAKQWEDSYYTEEQKELMDSMLQTLKNKSGMNEGGSISDQTEKAFSSNPFKGKKTVKRLKNVARNIPILGTAFDVADIASSVATGNLGQAAVDTGLALAGTTPVGRGITKLGKFAYSVFKKADDKDIALKMIKDKDARENWVKGKQKELGIDPNDPAYGDTDLVPKAEIKRRQTRKFDEQVEQLEKDEITGTEYRRFIRENQPATTFNKEDLDTMVPTFEDLVGGLDVRNANKASSGVIGLDSTIEKGAEVTARLDIPAYNNRDIWVATLRKIKGTAEDKKSKYGRTAVLKDVEFYIEGKAPKKITNVMGIGKGKKQKTPFATMKGKWQDVSDEDAFEMAKKAIDDPSYIQVGFNPERHSFFYDKATMLPVFEATNIIQIGPLVLAKVPGVANSALAAKTLSKSERVKRIGKLRDLRVDTSGKGEFPGRPRTYKEGGATMNKQMNMAFMQEGGMKDDGMDKDPVSGNDIPAGSLAKEVRDDIPAQLSEGEYVVPADVVQYYGVKFFEDLRMEAKMGLAQMDKDGRIGGEPISVTMIALGEEEKKKKAAMGGVVGYQSGGLKGKAADEAFLAQQAASNPLAGFQYTGQSLSKPPSQMQTNIPVTTMETWYHPDGRTQVVQLVNGQVTPPEMIQYTQSPWSKDASVSNKPKRDDDKEPVKLEPFPIGGKFGDVRMTKGNYDALVTSAKRLNMDLDEYYGKSFSERLGLVGKEFVEMGVASSEAAKVIKGAKEGINFDGLIELGKTVFKITPVGLALSFIQSLVGTPKESGSNTSTDSNDDDEFIYRDKEYSSAVESSSPPPSRPKIISSTKTEEEEVKVPKKGTGASGPAGGYNTAKLAEVDFGEPLNKGGLLTKPQRKPKKPRGKGLASK